MKKIDWLIVLSVCLSGLHTGFIVALLPEIIGSWASLLQYWRELFLGVLIVYALWAGIPKDVAPFFMAISGLVAYALIDFAIKQTTDIVQFMYGLRILILPLMFYALSFAFSEGNKLKYIMAGIVSIISIPMLLWGWYQSEYLGEEYLFGLGYVDPDTGRLPYAFYLSAIDGFIRPSSTLPGPNEYGAWAIISIFMSTYLYSTTKNNKLWILTGFVAFVSIMYTFSRSSIVGLIFGLLYFSSWRDGKFYMLRGVGIPIFTMIGCIFLLYGYILIFLPEFSIEIDKFIYSTFGFMDSSLVGHSDSLSSGVDIVIENIFGYGLGTAGPKAAQFGKYLHAESSFLTILFEIGVPGFFIYLAVLIMAFKKVHILSNNSMYARSVGAIFVAHMFIWLVLPINSALEVVVPMFVLMGLVSSKDALNIP